MGALIALLTLVVAVAGGAALVALVVLLVHGIQRGIGPSGPPSELGRAIGLVPQGTHDAVGERDGIRLHARWTTVSRGSGKSRRTVRVMRYTAIIDPPLRMGLAIGREGFLEGLFDSLGMSGDVVV